MNFFKKNPGRSIILASLVIVVGLAIFYLTFLFFLEYYNRHLNNKIEETKTAQNGGQNADLPRDLNYSQVENVYDILRQNYDGDLDEEKLLEGLIDGLVAAVGDVYTEYYNPEEAKKLLESLKDESNFEGVGIELTISNGRVLVVSPLLGSPASEAQILPKDEIIAVDEQPLAGLPLHQVSEMIRGPAGQPVTLTIRRKEVVFDVEIIRQAVNWGSLDWRVEDQIGIVQLRYFGQNSFKLLSQAADEFKTKQVKGIILDVRNNPGGEVTATQSVASFWLEPEETLFYKSVANQAVSPAKVNELNAQGEAVELARQPFWRDLPTVVITNEGSASASEIIAGALVDYGQATTIGQTTFGKGKIQTLAEIAKDKSILKVTTSRYLTPEKRTVDDLGLKPDILIEDLAETTDSQSAIRQAKKIIEQKLMEAEGN